MDIVYSARNLRKRYQKSSFTLTVEQIDLKPGSIIGVVGENGNGKTTLLSIVAGHLKAEGDIKYFGKSPESVWSWTEIKEKVAFIPQRIPKWYGSLLNNLRLKAALEGIPSDDVDPHLQELISFLGLEKFKDHKWSEISTGYRLRFELARVLIGSPKLIVLDEPIANLDINAQQRFLSDLKRIVNERIPEAAILLSSQQLHEIETVADSMVFLKDGSTHFAGSRAELQGEGSATFEVQTVTVDALKALCESRGWTLRKHGEYYRIDVSNALTPREFAQASLDAEVEYTYSRDISNSVKKLFELQ